MVAVFLDIEKSLRHDLATWFTQKTTCFGITVRGNLPVFIKNSFLTELFLLSYFLTRYFFFGPFLSRQMEPHKEMSCLQHYFYV